ncbi:MAG: hypothetical protein Crog4KO_00450 [Crocinitomicaceae bacterium]
MLSFGQDNGTWSISSQFQTDHNFIQLKTNETIFMTCVEPMWPQTLQFTSGIGVSYRFSNNLEFSTGVRYSRKRQQMTGYMYNSPLFCGTPDNCYISYIPMSQNYLEVPLLARYYFLPGKFKMHLEGGSVGSYQMKQNGSWSNASWLLGAQAGVGIDYFVNRWQFGIGANYRLQYQLGNRNYFYAINPHAFGFEFKTAFSLNNY